MIGWMRSLTLVLVVLTGCRAPEASFGRPPDSGCSKLLLEHIGEEDYHIFPIELVSTNCGIHEDYVYVLGEEHMRAFMRLARASDPSYSKKRGRIEFGVFQAELIENKKRTTLQWQDTKRSCKMVQQLKTYTDTHDLPRDVREQLKVYLSVLSCSDL